MQGGCYVINRRQNQKVQFKEKRREMKKSIIQVSAVIIMIAVLLIAGCSAPAASPAATTSASAPAAAAPQTFELKYANPYIEADDMFVGSRYMIEQMEKRTNGRVKITAYHNQTLGKVTDHLTMLDTGIADIAQVMPDMFNKVFAVPAMLLNGALDIPDSKAMVQECAYTLYRSGLMDKDFENYKLLYFEGTDSAGIAFKEKVDILATLQKLKVRTPPGSFTDEVKLMGASAVSIPAGEIYMALDRGTIDACVTMPGSYFAQKLNEIANWWVRFPMGIGVNRFIMPKAKWDSLPDDIKVIWDEVNAEVPYYYLNELEKRYPTVEGRFKENGVTTYFLSPQEKEQWMELIRPQHEAYLQKWEAEGFPVREADTMVRQVLHRFVSQ